MIGDKGYAGREFDAAADGSTPLIVRPRRKDEPGHGPHLAPIRQRIESDLLDLQRPAHASNATAPAPCTACAHASPTLPRLAAAIALNHRLGRPSRALADYTA